MGGVGGLQLVDWKMRLRSSVGVYSSWRMSVPCLKRGLRVQLQNKIAWLCDYIGLVNNGQFLIFVLRNIDNICVSCAMSSTAVKIE